MASKYCPKCGYANPAERGACLMCHTPLPAVVEGQQPVPVADAPPSPEAMAALLIEGVEGSLTGMEGGAMSTESDVEVPEEYEMAALEEMAVGPAPAPPTTPIEEAPPAEAAEEAAEEAEEEYIPPPPPPGAIELEEETAVPEQAVAEQEIFEAPPAPPAPEEVVELDEATAEEEAEEGAGGEWTISGD